MVKFCFRNWPKLPELIERCWEIENVEEHLEYIEKPLEYCTGLRTNVNGVEWF